MKRRKVVCTFVESYLGSKPFKSTVHDEYVGALAPTAEAQQEEAKTAAATEAVNEALSKVDAEAKKKKDEGDDEPVGPQEPTIFHRVTPGLIEQWPYLAGKEGAGIIYDYQIKGFLKESCGAMRNNPESLSARVANYKTKLTGAIFVRPRIIIPTGPDGVPCGLELLNATVGQGAELAKNGDGKLVPVVNPMIGKFVAKGFPLCVRPCRVETQKGPRTFIAQSEVMGWATQFEIEFAVITETLKEGADGNVNIWDLISELLSYGELKGLGPWRSGSHGMFTWKPAPLEPGGEIPVWNIRECGEPVITEESVKASKKKPAKK